MIRIKIEYEHECVHCLEISGHANYDEYGKDIVCAGVSAIAVGALNNLRTDDYVIVMEDGNIKVAAKGEITSHDQIVLETVIVQLQTMMESYPQFIKIIK